MNVVAWLKLGLVAILSGYLSVANAAPMLVGSGINGVTGIKNLAAGNKLWDVTLMEGTCVGVYGNCTNKSDFADYNEANTAVIALTNFLNYGGQNTNISNPVNTFMGAYARTKTPFGNFWLSNSSLYVLFDNGVPPPRLRWGNCFSCVDGWEIAAQNAGVWNLSFTERLAASGYNTASIASTAWARFTEVQTSTNTGSTTGTVMASSPNTVALLLLFLSAGMFRKQVLTRNN